MDIVISLILGFTFRRILNLRLAKGSHTLTITFWIFSGLGSVILLGVCTLYLFLRSQSGLDAFIDAINLIIIPISVYSLCIFLGLWRSSKFESRFLYKWGTRYISLIYLGAIPLPLIFNWFATLCFAIAVFTEKKYSSEKLIKTLQNT